MEDRILLKVSNETPTLRLGNAILKSLEENKKITLRAIGNVAVNQAVKGIAIANNFAKEQDKNIVFIPYISKVEFESGIKEAIEFDIEEV